jgi:ketosteroid isomerase-like protein
VLAFAVQVDVGDDPWQSTNMLKTMRSREEDAVADALIRQRIEGAVKAIGAKDLDGIMSLYAPDVVSYDLDPPLRYSGTVNKRRAWQAVFAAYEGPITYEVRDLDVTSAGDLAFVHSLNHVSGRMASGHGTDMWVRWTACFRRIENAWLIVHDHVSVPADLAKSEAAVHLKP